MDDQTFSAISKQLMQITEQYHAGQLKHYQYAEKYDNILLSHKVDKKKYRTEVEKRISNSRNG